MAPNRPRRPTLTIDQECLLRGVALCGMHSVCVANSPFCCATRTGRPANPDAARAGLVADLDHARLDAPRHDLVPEAPSSVRQHPALRECLKSGDSRVTRTSSSGAVWCLREPRNDVTRTRTTTTAQSAQIWREENKEGPRCRSHLKPTRLRCVRCRVCARARARERERGKKHPGDSSKRLSNARRRLDAVSRWCAADHVMEKKKHHQTQKKSLSNGSASRRGLGGGAAAGDGEDVFDRHEEGLVDLARGQREVTCVPNDRYAIYVSLSTRHYGTFLKCLINRTIVSSKDSHHRSKVGSPQHFRSATRSSYHSVSPTLETQRELQIVACRWTLDGTVDGLHQLQDGVFAQLRPVARDGAQSLDQNDG